MMYVHKYIIWNYWNACCDPSILHYFWTLL